MPEAATLLCSQGLGMFPGSFRSSVTNPARLAPFFPPLSPIYQYPFHSLAERH